MKILKDGSEVSSRSYYYLLDWNEVDEHNTLFELYGVMKLSKLLLSQYSNLFYVATQSEYKNLYKTK